MTDNAADDRRPRLLTGEEMVQTVASLDAAREEARKKEMAATGEAPYDRHWVVQMGKWHLHQGVSHFFEFGQCLMLLKENESWHTCANLIQEEFGIAERTARNYMRFAQVAAKFPRFKDFFTKDRMMRKGLALLEGVKDPENDALLAQFEETGEWGDAGPDDLLDKSVRQLKEQNKRLRREKDLIITGATKELADENEKLRAEVAALEAAQAVRGDLKAQRKLLKAGAALLEKAREVYGRADWPAIAADPGMKQLGAIQIDLAERLFGFLETQLFGGLPDDDGQA